MNIDLMESLAKVYIGRPVVVHVTGSRDLWGRAYWDRCLRVDMSVHVPADELAFTFMHEIGHIVMGHVPDKWIDDTGRVGQRDVQHVEPNSDGTFLERMRAHIDKREREADLWAVEHLAELRRRFPDIDALLLREG